MKNVIKNVLSTLIIATLVVLGIMYFSDVTERKESREKLAQFYEAEENIDVLFIGSSHVLNGIFPMELWNEYGIVSYNMAGHGNRMILNYWVLMNALEYTSPKLVVLDAYMLSLEDKLSDLEQLHISADSIPYSQTKVDMIEELVDEEDRKKDFLWKFSTYHHRWNELEKNDFAYVTTSEKGAESRINVAEPVEMKYFESDYKTPEEDGLGVEYACRIIEECQSRKIEVLVTYLPFPENTGWQGESNRMAEIAKEYGVDFLDYFTLLEQVNINTDYYDRDSHMNPSGARKVTSYIGNYIMQHYPIEDQRENEEYCSWHEDYEVYTEYKKDNIQKEKELKNLLMLLKDKNFSYGVYLKPWNSIDSHPVLVELLAGMGIDYSQIPNEDLFILVDNLSEERKELRLFETLETRFGDFSMFYNEDGHLELMNSEAESMIITYSDIAVVVFDNSDLSFVDQAKYTLSDATLEFLEDADADSN